MVEYALKWSSKAKNNLIEIHRFIFDQSKSKEQSLRVVQSIRQAAKKACLFPTKHRVEPTFENKSIRFTVKWKYKIIFEINEADKLIYILQVFDSRQNPNKIERG